jgi:hypothetical protein
MNTTNNKTATSATSANLPINVVTNNAKAQAKEQAQQAKAQAKADKVADKAQAKANFKALASVHNSFYSLIRTALDVANWGVNSYVNYPQEQQKALASRLRYLAGVTCEPYLNTLPTKEQLAQAVSNWATYTHIEGNKAQILKRKTLYKGAYVFEPCKYTFEIFTQAYNNKRDNKKQKQIADISLYYGNDFKALDTDKVTAKLKEIEQAKAQERTRKEQEQNALKSKAHKYDEYMKAQEQAKAVENIAKRQKQAQARQQAKTQNKSK